MLEQSTSMILKLWLNARMILMIFIKNIKEYKRKILVVFDGLIAYILSNKKLNTKVTELSIRGRKLNISLAFITQSYFEVKILA